jgi:hypothetical protein
MRCKNEVLFGTAIGYLRAGLILEEREPILTFAVAQAWVKIDCEGRAVLTAWPTRFVM